ncbi:MAG: DNA primase [Ilumatobacteraceae bacterium]
MAIVEEDLERLRSTAVLSDVVQQYVALRRVGRNWVGLCPFHAEKSGSFNVRDETGRYRCFGCGAAGDVFKFVQEIEHIDFVAAVEKLAGANGIQLRYTTGGEGRDRQRRKQLVEAMERAVDWYHQRLLDDPAARPARDYLRARGLSGETARTFRLGWAPDDWDALVRDLRLPPDVARDTGLAFTNKSGRLQDAFRGRVMFPIFTDSGEPVAFGGRILPGSAAPAKYKNSSETPIYAKSKTLYGLNWVKNQVVAADQVIVCEGYTDVIGFHRAGVQRAVATCGTALTEDHVRLLKRFASTVVLAFDADAAGQGAAQRFYEWEERYQVQVRVAHFPAGKDPGDLSVSDPEALRQAVERAEPFLGFRLNRVLASRPLRSPEDRARVAGDAMAIVNEHPNGNVRTLYAGQVAAHVGLPVADLVSLAAKGSRAPVVHVAPTRRPGTRDNAEFAAISLLVQDWDSIASWLVEALFADDVARRAFVAVGESNGSLDVALSLADPDAREFLERAAVADLDADPIREACTLIAAATRRELARHRVTVTDDDLAAFRDIRLLLERLDDPASAESAADGLLQWLSELTEETGEPRD